MTDAHTGTSPAGTDPRVLAMARAFDRTRRKVDGLDTRVCQLAADVARLAAVLTTAGPPTGPTTGPDDAAAGDDGEGGPAAVRSWLLGAHLEQADPDQAGPAQAVADLADLIEWLDRVYLRYPGAELTPCWLWHPHVIEELWWLRRAHADAYHPQDGSWLRVGDWHDRQRPAVAKRVREAIGKCDLTLHAPGKPQGQPPAVAPLAGHAAQIAVAWTTDAARPAPSREQLDEAAAYLQALHRSLR